MFIKKINWIDEDAQEAEVIVSDNIFEIICFAHPFIMPLNQKLKESIYCYDTQNIVSAFETIPYVKKRNNTYGYSIRGQLVNKTNKIVFLGNIILSIEDSWIPNDIMEGNYIEFDVARLDLF